MTGEVLYRMYRKVNLDKGYKIDEWNTLHSIDKAVWNDLAKWIQETE